jgi:hypothetical protein
VVAPTALDLALVLAIDTSGSISNQRLALQIDGYAAAFREPGLVRVIQAGRRGGIVVTFVEWSDATRQTQAVGWTLITDGETAQGFADAILKSFLPTPGWTSISGAIDFSARLFSALRLPADRRVIDISGDGTNNDGRSVETARDDAVAAGITINGLPILGVEPELDRYYRQHVIGGPQSFLVVARNEASFATAVMDKLLQEVAGTSSPRYHRSRV